MSSSQHGAYCDLPGSQPPPSNSQGALLSSSFHGHSQQVSGSSRPTVYIFDDLPSGALVTQEDFRGVFSGESKNVCFVSQTPDLSQNPEVKIADDERFGRVRSESPSRDLNPQGVGGSRPSFPSSSSQARSPSPALHPPRSPLPVSCEPSPPPAPRLYSRPSPSPPSSFPISSQSTGLDRFPPHPTPLETSGSIPSKFADASPSSTASNPSRDPSPEPSQAPNPSEKATRSISGNQASSSSLVAAKRSFSSRSADLAQAKPPSSATSAHPATRPASVTATRPAKHNISATATRPAKRSASATLGPSTKRAKAVAAAPDKPRLTRSSSRQELRPAQRRKQVKAQDTLPQSPKRKKSRVENPLPPPPKRKVAKPRANRTLSEASAKKPAAKPQTDENMPISQSSTRSIKPIPPLSEATGTNVPIRRVSARLQSQRARSNSHQTV